MSKKTIFAIFGLLLLNAFSLIININLLFLIAFDFCLLSFIYTINKFKIRYLYFFFLIAFFTYLVGGHMCYEYFGMEIKYYFSDEYYAHSNLCILIALIAVLVGYYFAEHFVIKSRGKILFALFTSNEKSQSLYCRFNIREASKILFYITCIFWGIEGFYDAILASGGNYYALYNTGSKSAPFLIRAAAALSPYLFYLFIATMPTKKECEIPLFLYISFAVLSLFSGQRRSFVNMFLFVILYYIYREYRNDKQEKWIQKRHIIFVIILIPVIMIVSFLWNFYRFGITYEGKSNIIHLLFGFLQQQGFSSSLLRLEKYYENSLNENAYYSFYSIIKNFRLNTVIRILFKPKYDFSYMGPSVDFAIKGNSLDNALSYIVLRQYNQGAGVGSCYLAELYHDFGYIGVFLGNIVYGITIQIIQRIWCSGKLNIWYTAIGFAMVDALLKVPRWNFDLIFSYLLDFGMWVSFIGVYIFAYILKNKQKSKKMI